MIVRVQNNLGTMKLKIDDDAGAMESTIRDAVMQECSQRQQRDNNNSSTKYKLTQALSFDPSCTHAIDPNQTLRSQGIQHGSMVYCRLEEAEAATAEEEEVLRHPLRDVDRTTFPLISECRLYTKKIHTVGYEITTSDPTDNDKITIEK